MERIEVNPKILCGKAVVKRPLPNSEEFEWKRPAEAGLRLIRRQQKNGKNAERKEIQIHTYTLTSAPPDRSSVAGRLNL